MQKKIKEFEIIMDIKCCFYPNNFQFKLVGFPRISNSKKIVFILPPHS